MSAAPGYAPEPGERDEAAWEVFADLSYGSQSVVIPFAILRAVKAESRVELAALLRRMREEARVRR